MYETEQQLIISKKIGRFLAPVVAKLDFDNVFGCTSLCLLKELSELEDGHCAEVESVAFLVKMGVRSSSDGWLCRYHTKCKVVVLPNEPGILEDRFPDGSGAQPLANRGYQGLFGKVPGAEDKEECEDTFSDFPEVDFDEIDDSAWNVDSDVEDVPDNSNGPVDNQKLLESLQTNADDRKDISRQIGQFVDASKYFVCVSTAGNHIQVLRKKAEQEKRKNKYADTFRHLSGAPKARECTSSRTCRINRSGMMACLDKIKVWVNWHGVVLCTSSFTLYNKTPKCIWA